MTDQRVAVRIHIIPKDGRPHFDFLFNPEMLPYHKIVDARYIQLSGIARLQGARLLQDLGCHSKARPHTWRRAKASEWAHRVLETLGRLRQAQAHAHTFDYSYVVGLVEPSRASTSPPPVVEWLGGGGHRRRP